LGTLLYLNMGHERQLRFNQRREATSTNHFLAMTNFLFVKECFLTDFYQNNRCDKDNEEYWWKVDLIQEEPILLRDGNGYELSWGEFKTTHNEGDNVYRDIICNMHHFDTVHNLDPRRFLLQDHRKSNALDTNSLFRNPILRRFYLSFLSVTARESYDASVPRNDFLRNAMIKCDGAWSAPSTDWEQHLAIYFHLDNIFIWYRNEQRSSEFENYHTFIRMRNGWMPYRTKEFCYDLWEFYEAFPWDPIYSDEWNGGKLKFDNHTNYSEIYSWVAQVLGNVKMMETALPMKYKANALID
jgi:hypothetical protein